MSTFGQRLSVFISRQKGEFIVTLFLVAGVILWLSAIGYPSFIGGLHGFLGSLFTIGSIIAFFCMYASKRGKRPTL
jgi:hypothetical protein